jgi:hypothetical protein
VDRDDLALRNDVVNREVEAREPRMPTSDQTFQITRAEMQRPTADVQRVGMERCVDVVEVLPVEGLFDDCCGKSTPVRDGAAAISHRDRPAATVEATEASVCQATHGQTVAPLVVMGMRRTR